MAKLANISFSSQDMYDDDDNVQRKTKESRRKMTQTSSLRQVRTDSSFHNSNLRQGIEPCLLYSSLFSNLTSNRSLWLCWKDSKSPMRFVDDTASSKDLCLRHLYRWKLFLWTSSMCCLHIVLFRSWIPWVIIRRPRRTWTSCMTVWRFTTRVTAARTITTASRPRPNPSSGQTHTSDIYIYIYITPKYLYDQQAVLWGDFSFNLSDWDRESEEPTGPTRCSCEFSSILLYYILSVELYVIYFIAAFYHFGGLLLSECVTALCYH